MSSKDQKVLTEAELEKIAGGRPPKGLASGSVSNSSRWHSGTVNPSSTYFSSSSPAGPGRNPMRTI